MKSAWVLIFVLAASPIQAEVALSDDGEQIELRADGTWVRLSRDRFATDEQGRRIRLRPDGTWNVVELSSKDQREQPARPPTTAPTLLDEPRILLEKVEIQRRTIKRAKTDHAEIRLRFEVEVTNITDSVLEIPPDLQMNVKATSNRGGDYPLIAVELEKSTLPAGEKTQMVVWAQGAPRWFGTKFLSLAFPAGALGNGVERIVSKNMDEIARVEVRSF